MQGASSISEDATTRLRRGSLLSFASERSGSCTGEEVRQYLCARSESPEAINNQSTIYLSFSNPQVDRTTLWVAQPKAVEQETGFVPMTVV